MASCPPSHSQARTVFDQKTKKLGLEPWPGPIPAWLSVYPMETLALIWPEKSYAFEQIVRYGKPMKEVADALQVVERTVHGLIYGSGPREDRDWGAIDWLLILLELYREADCVYPGGASTLAACFTPAVSAGRHLLQVPFHRSLYLAVLEAFVGEDSSVLEASFPWTDSREVVAWPYLKMPPPLARSWLPGLLAVLQRCRSHEDLAWVCHLIVEAANNVDDPKATRWGQLLQVLNTGGAATVARGGAIPDDRLAEACNLSGELLLSVSKDSAAAFRYAALGILSRTSLPRASLGGYANDSVYATLAEPEDVLYCVRRCFSWP